MARISGIDLPENSRIDYALTKIRGIGWALSTRALKNAKIDPSKKTKDLTTHAVGAIAKAIEKFPTEGDLARLVRTNIQRLQTAGTYRGIRHSRNLPVRGQRTKSNARTKRGKRKTVGAFKKEELSKQPSSTQ